MRRLACVVLLVGGLALGAAPESPFTLPTAPVVVPPAPNPGAVPKLTAGYLYVVNSKVDAHVTGYPAGLVKVEKKKGPRDITAMFVDGNGSIEDRTYEGPFVFVVRAVGKGRVDLVLTPKVWATEADIVSRTIDVDAGQAPLPPPKPDDPPVTVDLLAMPVQTAFTADASTTKVADKTSLAAVYGAVAESLGDVRTAGDLFAVIKGATEARIAGRLKPVRAIFGDELGKVLPADPAAVLTVQHKTDAAKQLNRFATVLGGVK